MKEQIIDLFTQFGRFKIVFGKGILIRANPTDQPKWIDEITVVKLKYLVTISNANNDNYRKPIEELTEFEQTKLKETLEKLVNQKQLAA